jgi:hypothetical protein
LPRKIKIDSIGKTFEFPDGTPDDVIDKAVREEILPQYQQQAALTNQAPQSFGDKVIRGAKAFGGEFVGNGGAASTVGGFIRSALTPQLAAQDMAKQSVDNARAEGGDAYAYGANFAKGLPVVGPVVRAGESQAQGKTPEAIGQGLAGLAQYAGVRSVEPAARAIESVPESIPSLERAGGNFQDVMGAAKNKPVPITNELSGALSRYQELVDRGGSRSIAVSKLLNRITNPDAGPMTYGEARDFASNISRLSADEFMRLTPQMKQQVGAIRVALNNAVGQTAESVGKGAQYQSAMKEYAKAAQINQLKQQATDVVVRKVLPAAGYGILAKKAYDVFGK